MNTFFHFLLSFFFCTFIVISSCLYLIPTEVEEQVDTAGQEEESSKEKEDSSGEGAQCLVVQLSEERVAADGYKRSNDREHGKHFANFVGVNAFRQEGADNSVLAVAHSSQGLSKVELPESVGEGDDGGTHHLTDGDDEKHEGIMNLKFSAEDWHYYHEADKAEERHDNVEEGIIGFAEAVKDQQQVEVGEAVNLQGEEVHSVAEQLKDNQKFQNRFSVFCDD